MAGDLVTINSGELVRLGSEIINLESIGVDTAGDTYLAGDSTFKLIAPIAKGNVGTILNMYNNCGGY